MRKWGGDRGATAVFPSEPIAHTSEDGRYQPFVDYRSAENTRKRDPFRLNGRDVALGSGQGRQLCFGNGRKEEL